MRNQLDQEGDHVPPVVPSAMVKALNALPDLCHLTTQLLCQVVSYYQPYFAEEVSEVSTLRYSNLSTFNKRSKSVGRGGRGMIDKISGLILF